MLRGKSVLMKVKSFYLSLFLLSGLAAKSQEAKKDTAFLLKEENPHYHVVFVDSNKQSTNYSDIIGNKKSSYDTAVYKASIAKLKYNGIKISKHAVSGFAKSWHPLYILKGRYYVYYPSDSLHNNWLTISDSIILKHIGSEPEVLAVNQVKSTNNSRFQIAYRDRKGENKRLNIFIVDPTNGIAIFEYKGADTSTYELRVATSKIKNFPMVVNYCAGETRPEFPFDAPNYKELIKVALRRE